MGDGKLAIGLIDHHAGLLADLDHNLAYAVGFEPTAVSLVQQIEYKANPLLLGV